MGKLSQKCYDARKLFASLAMQILLFSNHRALIDHVRRSLADDNSSHTLIHAGTLTDAITSCKLNQPAIIIIDVSTAPITFFAHRFIEHYHRKLRPAIVLFSQDDNLPMDIASLGVQGVHAYGDNKFPCMADIIECCTQPTLAQRQSHEYVMIRSHRGDERIFIDDIFYCQAEQKYTKIRHRHGTTFTDDTLKSLESLHPAKLVRIHRHTLVGMAHIRAITSDDGHQLHLYGVSESLDISRRCLPALRDKLKSSQDNQNRSAFAQSSLM